MTKKSKIASIFLCLALIMTVIPMSYINVSAGMTEIGLWVGGVKVTESNQDDVLGDGTVSYSETDTTATLTLDGANITKVYEDDNNSAGIYYNGAKELTIDTVTDSTVDISDVSTTKDFSTGIRVYNVDVTFTGDGKLIVTGGEADFSSGVKVVENITINGTLEANGGTATNNSYGFYSYNDITVNGTLVASGSDAYDSFGVYFADNLTVKGTLIANGGTATNESYGVLAGGDITVNGTLESNGGTATNVSYGVDTVRGNIIVNGTVVANGGTVTNESYGVLANGNITVNGTLEAFGKTDAFNKKPTLADGVEFEVKAGDDDTSATLVTDLAGTDYHTNNYVKIKRIVLWVNGVGVTESNQADVLDDGTVSYVETDTTATLTLDGANITSVYETGDNSSGIYYKGKKALTIDTVSDSEIDISAVTTNKYYSHGIYVSKVDVTFSGGGKLIVTGGEAAYSFGIYAYERITVNGTVVANGGTATDGSYGVYSNNGITVNGKLVANGGTATNESYGVVTVSGNLTVNGTIEATGGEAATDNYGVAADSITVNGTLEAFGKTDAFNKKPTLTDGVDLIVKSGDTMLSATKVIDLATTDYHLDNYAIIYTEKEFEILDGDNQTPTVGTDGTLTFRSAGEFDKFLALYLNGVLVDASNYTVDEGSTIITLKADYVKNLPLGEKEFTLEFVNGYSTVNMEVVAEQQTTPPSTGGDVDDGTTDTDKPDTDKPDTDKPDTDQLDTDSPQTGDNNNNMLLTTDKPDTDQLDTDSPQTGDNNNNMLLTLVMLISLCGIGAVVYRRKIVK